MKYKAKVKKIIKNRIKSNRGNIKKERAQRKAISVSTKPTTNKEPINWPTFLFETEYFTFEQKKAWSDSNTEPLPSGHGRYLQAKFAGSAPNFEFGMSQDTNDSNYY